jgi:hypothetical protein
MTQRKIQKRDRDRAEAKENPGAWGKQARESASECGGTARASVERTQGPVTALGTTVVAGQTWSRECFSSMTGGEEAVGAGSLRIWVAGSQETSQMIVTISLRERGMKQFGERFEILTVQKERGRLQDEGQNN